VDLAAAEATARLAAGASGSARPVQCDVTSDAAQEAAFAQHVEAHGGIDIAVLNAGIYERGEKLAGAAGQVVESLPARRTLPCSAVDGRHPCSQETLWTLRGPAGRPRCG